jgi:hypothetical protein
VWIRILVVLLLALLVVGGAAYRYVLRDETVDYPDIREHFKYGSIGSEPGGAIWNPVGGFLPPDRIFNALPRVCPDRLPGGYPSLGLIWEEGRDLPIGISRRRRLGSEMLGINCALCHVGSVRDAASGSRHIVLGMPAGQVDVHLLLKFSIDCLTSTEFEDTDRVLRAIEGSGRRLGWLERRIAYPYLLLPRLRAKAAELKQRLAYQLYEAPDSGPGRLDTISPVKALELGWTLRPEMRAELIGVADFPPTWRLGPRDFTGFFWDGHNTSLEEVFRSVVLGVGVRPETVDQKRLDRVIAFLRELAPPPYPYRVDERLVAAGGALFAQHCARCHERQVGAVTPIVVVGSDDHRFRAFTAAVADGLRGLADRHHDPRYRFQGFVKTDGYLNVPLDGIWARAPYLHNGSVPTLRDLLEPPERRPQFFYRGSDVFDPVRVGFIALPADAGVRFEPVVGECPRRGRHPHVPVMGFPAEVGRPRLFLFDTRCDGNDNRGHDFGTALSDGEKTALVEYLKTR